MRPRLLPVLLLPALLAGCGGDDDPGPGSSPAASARELDPGAAADRAAYVTAAEGVCARAIAAGKLVPQPTSAEQYVSSFTQTLAVGEEGLKGLTALTPPAADAAALEDAFLDPVAQQVANFREALPVVRAAAASADPAAALAKIPDPGAAVTVDLDFIEQYGMPSCAVFAGKG